MKILYIGNFQKLWDEEYIARSFEELGHEVYRVKETENYTKIIGFVEELKPDFVLFAKFRVGYPEIVLKAIKKLGIKTVCWVFDLYWGYTRENRIFTDQMFQADIVFSTDGGNAQKWIDAGVNHKLLRQGIYKPECYTLQAEKEVDVLFVGSDNPANIERQYMLHRIDQDFKLTWIGKRDTNETRGEELNRLYAKSKIVVGDSVYSPHYWSNRVVETLGRGGFLIHVDVEGIKEEYPHLVTYKRGDYNDLKEKIEYYLTHDSEREEIVKKNHEWVLNNYTCVHKCMDLIANL